MVKIYKSTQKIDLCKSKINELLDIFIKESTSYFQEDKSNLIFRGVLEFITLDILKEKRGRNIEDTQKQMELFLSKRNGISPVRKEISSACNWLIYCGLVDGCDEVNDGNLLDKTLFSRLYITDCGLLNNLLQSANIKDSNKKGIL